MEFESHFALRENLVTFTPLVLIARFADWRGTFAARRKKLSIHY